MSSKKTKKSRKEDPAVLPTGRSSNGNSHFVVGDTYRGGRHKIALLPAGGCLVIEEECHLNDRFGTFKGHPVWWNVLESTEKGRHYRCKHVFEKDDDGNPQKYCTTEIFIGPTVNISSLYAITLQKMRRI